MNVYSKVFSRLEVGGQAGQFWGMMDEYLNDSLWREAGQAGQFREDVECERVHWDSSTVSHPWDSSKIGTSSAGDDGVLSGTMSKSNGECGW